MVVFATSETDKDCVSCAAGEMCVSHARGRSGKHPKQHHTEKPKRCLSPILTSTPKATALSELDRMQGPDHYRTSSVSITSSDQWDLSTQPPGSSQRNGVILPLVPSRMCDATRPPSQESFKHICREEIPWTGLHLSTDSLMPMAEAAICCFYMTSPLPPRLCSKTTKPGNTRLDQISCSGNAVILARSHTCDAGMALEIHDVEQAFPVRHLVRRYLRRQSFNLPIRLRSIEGYLARRNSNGVSTAGTRAVSNSTSVQAWYSRFQVVEDYTITHTLNQALYMH